MSRQGASSDLRRAALILATIVVTGCLHVREYSRPVVDVPADYRYAGDETQGSTLAEVPAWWRAFQDARPVGVFAFLQEAALESFLLVGLFLLGGDFWDKVRALFRHRAKVEFSPNAPATARA